MRRKRHKKGGCNPKKIEYNKVCSRERELSNYDKVLEKARIVCYNLIVIREVNFGYSMYRLNAFHLLVCNE